jgi:hypothetical protein
MAETTPPPFGFAGEPDEPRPSRPPKLPDERPRPRKPKAAKHRDEASLKSKSAPAPKQASLLWLLAVAVPLIGFAVFMAVRQASQRSSAQEAFAAEMAKLAAPPKVGPVKATPGKLAIIDVDKRELHYLHHATAAPAPSYRPRRRRRRSPSSTCA